MQSADDNVVTDFPRFRPGSDKPFIIGLSILSGTYAVIIVAMIVADIAYVDADSMLSALRSKEIQYSIGLSLLSCSLSTLLSLWVAIPLGYLTSRFDFPGKRLLDTVLDIPIVLPPLVIGISLLALFNFLKKEMENHFQRSVNNKTERREHG